MDLYTKIINPSKFAITINKILDKIVVSFIYAPSIKLIKFYYKTKYTVLNEKFDYYNFSNRKTENFS